MKKYAPFLTALSLALATLCLPAQVLAKTSKTTVVKTTSAQKSTAVKKSAAVKKSIVEKKSTSSNKAAKVLASNKKAKVRVTKLIRPKASEAKMPKHARSFGAPSARKARIAAASRVHAPDPERLSFDGTPRLQSQAALVIDQETQQVLFRKNERAVLPIASITKLMTALLISQAKLPLDEDISISTDDVDTEKGSRSRLVIGSTLSRSEMLHLALMSSENRAAHALGRTYPGGMNTFVYLMNAKAAMLGMKETRYVDPTGLSSQNRSSAHDLAILVKAAHADPLVRQYSTDLQHDVTVGSTVLQYNTTNALVRDPNWEIGLQKTGYISEAGRCMVVQAMVAGRKVIMVFLDSATSQSRTADARGVRRWLEKNSGREVLSAQNAAQIMR